MGALKEQQLPREIEKEVDARAKQLATEQHGSIRLGYCHTFWSIKKKILMEDYGIDWQTPADLNPEVCFD